MIPHYYWVSYVEKLIELSNLGLDEKDEMKKPRMQDGFLTFECIERGYLPKLYFLFKEDKVGKKKKWTKDRKSRNDYKWMVLDPEDYIFDISTPADELRCSIAIVGNKQNFFIFGNSFLRGYYSIFVPGTPGKMDGFMKIGPHARSRKEHPREGILPVTNLVGESHMHWATCLIIFFLAMAWALTDGYFLHDYLVYTAKLQTDIITIIESVCALGVSVLAVFILVPLLNDIFNVKYPNKTSVHIELVHSSRRLQASSGAALLLLGTVARRKLFGKKEKDEETE